MDKDCSSVRGRGSEEGRRWTTTFIPYRVCHPGSSNARRRIIGHRRVSQLDPRRPLSCVCYVWLFIVGGLAFAASSTRDDRDYGFSYEPVPLLNRISRRVSASGYIRRRDGPGVGGRLQNCPNQ